MPTIDLRPPPPPPPVIIFKRIIYICQTVCWNTVQRGGVGGAVEVQGHYALTCGPHHGLL